MDVLTRDDLQALANRGPGPRVSVYMPTHRFGPSTQEDQTRLRVLLGDAERELESRGVKGRDAEALLRPARKLIEDRPFWLRSREGLAVFADAEGSRAFRLLEPFTDEVIVGERFYLKPLLRALGSARAYWVLALSQKRARLFRGSRYHLTEIDLSAADLPTSLAEAVKWFDFEKQSLQFHTQTSGGPGGRRPAVFHGTGELDAKKELERYFREIDAGLAGLLGAQPAPLVLVGVDYLLPIYREQNTYAHLAEQAVTGNPETLGVQGMHEQTWQVASTLFDAERAEAAERVVEQWASPRATNDPGTIIAAAHQGRVETLFVAHDRHWWGAYDESSATATLHDTRHPGDEDLLDAAALRTLLTDGEIHAVAAEDVPQGGEAAALLRY
ncbi:MAG: hypothetical protein QMC79_09345 [Anaerosomatales bacterium]|nr:hypothetical protein [Anaerosomatales bacterium]